jgi:hypothetical protein
LAHLRAVVRFWTLTLVCSLRSRFLEESSTFGEALRSSGEEVRVFCEEQTADRYELITLTPRAVFWGCTFAKDFEGKSNLALVLLRFWASGAFTSSSLAFSVTGGSVVCSLERVKRVDLRSDSFCSTECFRLSGKTTDFLPPFESYCVSCC